MEEATIELRNAIHLALSLEPNNDRGGGGGGSGGNDELLNNDVQAHHGSSEGTYISSLSGSLPSERSNALASRRKNYYAANNMMGAMMTMEDHDHNNGGRHAWQRRRLHVATSVETAVSNYEVAVFNFHNGSVLPSTVINGLEGERRDGFANEGPNEQGDIVDLLVAVLTSVPRILLQQADLLVGENGRHPQDEESYISSMEQICFNASCISSDVIRKYFQSAILANLMENSPMLEDRHICELIDEVAQICNTDTSWSNNVDPIVRILNSLSEGREIERSVHEREHGDSYSNGHGYQTTLFSCLSSNEALRLTHSLMYRFLCDQEDESVDASSHIGYFISYLLEHFANAVVIDMGYDDREDTTIRLFEAWADVADEHMAQRLNDEEARDVYDLIVRYHVGSIQSALELIENAESIISNAIAESEKNDGVDDNTVESLVIALQDTIRHMAMVATTTEVMDKLSLQHDPEIHVIFHPLIVSYARFTVSFLHDALQFLRGIGGNTHEGEETSILADDLLFRICRVSIGIDFLKSSTNTCDEEEVLAISLLRATSSQCIAGKARFLLEIAAERARNNSAAMGNIATSSERVAKRQRFHSSFGSGQMQNMHKDDRFSPSEESRGEMVDIILACLAMSRPNQDDGHPDASIAKQASCITSALMSSQGEESGDGIIEHTVLDPLNPWHTLQVKPMQRLAEFAPSSNAGDEEGNPSDSLLAYALTTPHLLDTKPSTLSFQN